MDGKASGGGCGGILLFFTTRMSERTNEGRVKYVLLVQARPGQAGGDLLSKLGLQRYCPSFLVLI